MESVLFRGARHELCHELNRDEVYDTVIEWLNRHAYTEVNLTYPEDGEAYDDPYDRDPEDEEEPERDEDPDYRYREW